MVIAPSTPRCFTPAAGQAVAGARCWSSAEGSVSADICAQTVPVTVPGAGVHARCNTTARSS